MESISTTDTTELMESVKGLKLARKREIKTVIAKVAFCSKSFTKREL